MVDYAVLINTIDKVLQLTRNETTRQIIYEKNSFESLPPEFRRLNTDLQLTKFVFNELPQGMTQDDVHPLYRTILTVYYYIIEQMYDNIYNYHCSPTQPTGTFSQNLPHIITSDQLRVLTILFRILNNLCFIPDAHKIFCAYDPSGSSSQQKQQLLTHYSLNADKTALLLPLPCINIESVQSKMELSQTNPSISTLTPTKPMECHYIFSILPYIIAVIEYIYTQNITITKDSLLLMLISLYPNLTKKSTFPKQFSTPERLEEAGDINPQNLEHTPNSNNNNNNNDEYNTILNGFITCIMMFSKTIVNTFIDGIDEVYNNYYLAQQLQQNTKDTLNNNVHADPSFALTPLKNIPYKQQITLYTIWITLFQIRSTQNEDYNEKNNNILIDIYSIQNNFTVMFDIINTISPTTASVSPGSGSGDDDSVKQTISFSSHILTTAFYNMTSLLNWYCASISDENVVSNGDGDTGTPWSQYYNKYYDQYIIPSGGLSTTRDSSSAYDHCILFNATDEEFNQDVFKLKQNHYITSPSTSTTLKTPTLLNLFFIIMCSFNNNSNALMAKITPQQQSQANVLIYTNSNILQHVIYRFLLNFTPILLSSISIYSIHQFQVYANLVNPSTASVAANPMPNMQQLQQQQITPQQYKNNITLNNNITLYYLSIIPLLVFYNNHIIHLQKNGCKDGLGYEDNDDDESCIAEQFRAVRHEYIDYIITEFGVDIEPENEEDENDYTLKESCISSHEIVVDCAQQCIFSDDKNVVNHTNSQQQQELDYFSQQQEAPEGDNTKASDDYGFTPFLSITTSPIFSTQHITQTVLSIILSGKYIWQQLPPQPSPPLASVNDIIDQKHMPYHNTPICYAQLYLNHFIRHYFSYIILNVITYSNAVIDFLLTYCNKTILAGDDEYSDRPVDNILIKYIIKNVIFNISDLYTILSPITLSSLSCQLFLLNQDAQILTSILHSILYDIIVYFIPSHLLTNEITNYTASSNLNLSRIFTLLSHMSKYQQVTNNKRSVGDDDHADGLLNTFLTPFPYHINNNTSQFNNYNENLMFPYHSTSFLKVLSSLPYRALTLIGYIIGNTIPAAQPQSPPLPFISPTQLPSVQQRILAQIITPQLIYNMNVLTYYYIDLYVYFNTIYNGNNNQHTLQYNLLYNIQPSIIDVMEGILTLLTNISLYFNKFQYQSPHSQAKCGGVISHHPSLLIYNGATYQSLLRLLTLGWDGDNIRYNHYNSHGTHAPHSPSHADGDDDIIELDLTAQQAVQPEVELIFNIFYTLYDKTTAGKAKGNVNSGLTTTSPNSIANNTHNATNNGNNSSTSTTSTTVVNNGSIINDPFAAIPGYVLQHKLPLFQILTLRLLRFSAQNILLHYSTNSTLINTSVMKNLTHLKGNNSTNKKTQTNTKNTTISSPPPFANAFNTRNICELMTSLYALTAICPISTLKYESARLFSYITQLITVTNTTSNYNIWSSYFTAQQQHYHQTHLELQAQQVPTEPLTSQISAESSSPSPSPYNSDDIIETLYLNNNTPFFQEVLHCCVNNGLTDHTNNNALPMVINNTIILNNTTDSGDIRENGRNVHNSATLSATNTSLKHSEDSLIYLVSNVVSDRVYKELAQIDVSKVKNNTEKKKNTKPMVAPLKPPKQASGFGTGVSNKPTINIPAKKGATQKKQTSVMPVQQLLFQIILNQLLQLNPNTPDGRLLVNEAHAAIKALGLA